MLSNAIDFEFISAIALSIWTHLSRSILVPEYSSNVLSANTSEKPKFHLQYVTPVPETMRSSDLLRSRFFYCTFSSICSCVRMVQACRVDSLCDLFHFKSLFSL